MVCTILSSHYVVVPSLSYVIAVLALRLQTGTKPKWQMGRKGRRSCDAGTEIFNRKGWLHARCSARPSAHWLLKPKPTRVDPALATRGCMPSILLYNELQDLQQFTEKHIFKNKIEKGGEKNPQKTKAQSLIRGHCMNGLFLPVLNGTNQ